MSTFLTISCRACSIISMKIRRPETSFESRVVFGNCGGAQRVEENAVGFESFTRSKQGEIWLLTLYAKNVAESISGRTLKKIKEEIGG